MNKLNRFLVISVFIVILSSVLTTPFIIASNNAHTDKSQVIKLTEGTTAPDFSIIDVDTNITYKLSDFHGKVVMIDHFATWCGPCQNEVPHLVDIYNTFPHDKLQIISVDVSSSDSLESIKNFRQRHHMDWIVGKDIDGSIADAYGVSGIPQLDIVDQDQKIAFELIGFDESVVSMIKNKLYELIPDETAPVVNQLSISECDNLSIYNPTVRVFANISEDMELSKVSLSVVGSNGVTALYPLPLGSKTGNQHIINETVSLEPLFIYPQEYIQFGIAASDFVGHISTSTLQKVTVVSYSDSKAPELKDISVKVSEKDSTHYQIDLALKIEEDLFLVSAKGIILKSHEAWYSKPLLQVNESYWEATFVFSKTAARLCELNITVSATDVANNTVEQTLPVPTDLDPNGCQVSTNDTNNNSTSSTDFVSLLLIGAIIVGLASLNLKIIRRKKV